jgi:hypothetical protein
VRASVKSVRNRGGQLATDRGDRVGDVALRPDRGRLASGSITTGKGRFFECNGIRGCLIDLPAPLVYLMPTAPGQLYRDVTLGGVLGWK